MRMAAIFGAAACVLASVVALLSGVLAELASGGAITLGPGLLLAFSCPGRCWSL